jgi:hypothetical protein
VEGCWGWVMGNGKGVRVREERGEGRGNEPAPGGRELVAILYDNEGG